MIDSITNLYTSMQQSAQQTEISTAVLAKSIDSVRQAGENVESLLQAAGTTSTHAGGAVTDPMVGQVIDLTV
jgi:hypothetical protein